MRSCVLGCVCVCVCAVCVRVRGVWLLIGSLDCGMSLSHFHVVPAQLPGVRQPSQSESEETGYPSSSSGASGDAGILVPQRFMQDFKLHPYQI